MVIQKLLNEQLQSNCYVINNESFIYLIDPGSETISQTLIAQFPHKKFIIFLTHGHFDHIMGLNAFKKHSNYSIIGHNETVPKLKDPKKNLSYFFNIPYKIEDSLLPHFIEMNIPKDKYFEIIETPGHSDCGITIVIENNFFIGDLINEKLEYSTKLPEGSIVKSNNSIMKLKSIISPDSILFPGHGNSFSGELLLSK